MPSTQLTTSIRAVRSAYYVLGAVIITMPLVDWARSLFPMHIDLVGYRFASLQLLSANLMTPMVGIGIILLVAFLSESRRGVLAVRTITLIGIFLLLAAMLLFPIDVLQVRGSTPPELKKTVIDQAAGFAMFRFALAMTCLIAFFRASTRALRHLPDASKTARRQPLVVG